MSWLDAVKWANAKSEMEGLSPLILWEVASTERAVLNRRSTRPPTATACPLRLNGNGSRILLAPPVGCEAGAGPTTRANAQLARASASTSQTTATQRLASASPVTPTDLRGWPDRQTQVGVKLRWLVALAVNWKYQSFRGGWIDAMWEDNAAVPIHVFGHDLHHDYRVDLLF